MKKISRYTTDERGMTLIEVSIYTVLISVIMTTMVNFLYVINMQQVNLENDIQHAFIK